MSCGGNLAVLRAEAERKAEIERRTEEAAARVRQTKAYVTKAISSGKSLGEVYTSLVSAGWGEAKAAKLVELDGHELVIGIGGRVYFVVASASEAKSVTSGIRTLMKQLRLQKKHLNTEIRETRQAFAASKPASLGRSPSFGGGGFGKAMRAVDGLGREMQRHAITQHKAAKDQEIGKLEDLKAQLDAELLECEKAVNTIDGWCLQQEAS